MYTGWPHIVTVSVHIVTIKFKKNFKRGLNSNIERDFECVTPSTYVWYDVRRAAAFHTLVHKPEKQHIDICFQHMSVMALLNVTFA